MIKKQFPCVCGHWKAQHGIMVSKDNPVCCDCMNEVKKNIDLGMVFAHKYKEDNLRYLELEIERNK